MLRTGQRDNESSRLGQCSPTIRPVERPGTLEKKKKKKQALKRAIAALKKYTRRSNVGKELDRQVWNVVLAGGCVNRLEVLTQKLEQKYEDK